MELLQPDEHPRRVVFAQWFVNQRVADIHLQGDGTTWEIHLGTRLRVKVVPP